MRYRLRLNDGTVLQSLHPFSKETAQCLLMEMGSSLSFPVPIHLTQKQYANKIRQRLTHIVRRRSLPFAFAVRQGHWKKEPIVKIYKIERQEP